MKRRADRADDRADDRDDATPEHLATHEPRPKLMILIGVWLLFGSTLLISVASLANIWSTARDDLDFLVRAILPLLFASVCVAVLGQQTRRWLAAREVAHDAEYDCGDECFPDSLTDDDVIEAPYWESDRCRRQLRDDHCRPRDDEHDHPA